MVDYPDGWENVQPSTAEDAYILAARLQGILEAMTSRQAPLVAFENLLNWIRSQVAPGSLEGERSDLELRSASPRCVQVHVMDSLSIAQPGEE